MKPGTAPTLSQHLLNEASKFFRYPRRQRRTKTTLESLDWIDNNVLKEFVEWRKTFAPDPKSLENENRYDPILLDELYCRLLLRAVPAMVQRTRALAKLALPTSADLEWLVYLRESASCLIFGLPQAAAALARAAVESRLREACATVFGDKAVREADLSTVISDFCSRGKVLSPEVRKLAHSVRVAANNVLHGRPMEAGEALRVFEAARSVILNVAVG